MIDFYLRRSRFLYYLMGIIVLMILNMVFYSAELAFYIFVGFVYLILVIKKYYEDLSLI